MIVRDVEGGLRLVRQSDHAASSAVLAHAWRRPGRLAFIWDRFVEAVRRHDDGWIEEERSPLLDPRGRPYDFKSLPAGRHAAVWRRGVELARRDDAYLSLLIAQHARWLYLQFTPEEARGGAEGFVEEMERSMERDRQTLRAGSPEERRAVEAENLRLARALLSFLDGLSLHLLGAVRMQRTEPLAFEEGEEPLKLEESGPEGLRLLPWPFESRSTVVETRAVRVGRPPFASPEALALAMEGAPVESLRFTLGR